MRRIYGLVAQRSPRLSVSSCFCGAESFARATVVAILPDGMALAVGEAEEHFARLMTKPADDSADDAIEKKQNAWDRIRGLSQMERLLLAVKADRTERALLLQDNDPRVLLSLLRNPRLTVDEVARLAKSSFLTYQIADVIMKTSVRGRRAAEMHHGDTRSQRGVATTKESFRSRVPLPELLPGRGRHAAKRSAGEGRRLKPQVAQAPPPHPPSAPSPRKWREGLSMERMRENRQRKSSRHAQNLSVSSVPLWCQNLPFMNVTRTASTAFTVVFESEEELREEHRANLSMGGLRLATTETVALNATLLVTLRGPWGGESFARATVVAILPDGMALAVGEAEEHFARLMTKPADDSADDAIERKQNVWDRIRSLSQMEKLLLAVKADRTERALLLQDNDPRVLLSLLRNPRLTVDEVARLAKSSFLTYQIADVIMKTGQWMANLDVRLGLIHNAKTPPAFSLRILPTLPDSEVRSIARTGTNMALKTAALRQLQGR